jgi:hypothetical protein
VQRPRRGSSVPATMPKFSLACVREGVSRVGDTSVHVGEIEAAIEMQGRSDELIDDLGVEAQKFTV